VCDLIFIAIRKKFTETFLCSSYGFFNKRQKLASEKATTIRMRGAFYVKPLCGHLEVLHIFRGIFEGKKQILKKQQLFKCGVHFM